MGLSVQSAGTSPASRLLFIPRICKPKQTIQEHKGNFPPETWIQGRSRKEVFQPHLPVRLPCYDLAPITGLTLGRPSRLRTSGTPGFHGLTGGVYKARERIHRASPNWEGISGSAAARTVASLCAPHCNTCVAPDVRAVLI